MVNLSPIIQAVQESVTLCHTVQQRFLVSNTKSTAYAADTEPVTIADYGTQAIICRALQKHFPDDAVIAEEAGSQFMELVSPSQRQIIVQLLTNTLDQNVTEEEVVAWLDHGKGVTSERTWVIDPIDGTKGFINLRHYAIAVGMLENGVPQRGVLGCPGYEGMPGGVLFYSDGEQVFRQPLQGGDAEIVRVSSREKPDELVVTQSFEKKHASKSRMGRVRELAGLENAAVSEMDSMEKYALVACGDADLYLRLPNLSSTRPHMIWDHAAGAALVQTAGGKVSDVDGSPLDFSAGHTIPNLGMVISNGKIHDQVIEATKQLLAEERAALEESEG